jgi:predicted  nucleic acid-binding Zn-ribbon protein
MLEDRVLEAMMIREEADEEAQAAADRLQTLKEARAHQHADLHAELDTLKAEAESLREARTRVRTQLPDAILDSYDYLWERTNGLPVAQLNRGICSVCGLEVLKPIQQKVQRGQEAYCDSCRRLIVS